MSRAEVSEGSAAEPRGGSSRAADIRSKLAAVAPLSISAGRAPSSRARSRYTAVSWLAQRSRSLARSLLDSPDRGAPSSSTTLRSNAWRAAARLRSISRISWPLNAITIRRKCSGASCERSIPSARAMRSCFHLSTEALSMAMACSWSLLRPSR